MILTVASFKGGVGKTTTAIHLAGYLQQSAPTLLIDGDKNRSAALWAKAGHLPFTVVNAREAPRHAKNYEHMVIDTEAGPEQEDLRSLVAGCDLLVIPTTPDLLSVNALMLTIRALRDINSSNHKVLLTIIPPPPSKEGAEARETFQREGIPLFDTGIRRFVAFQKAVFAGKLVSEVRDRRAPRGWEDYAGVGKEILP